MHRDPVSRVEGRGEKVGGSGSVPFPDVPWSLGHPQDERRAPEYRRNRGPSSWVVYRDRLVGRGHLETSRSLLVTYPSKFFFSLFCPTTRWVEAFVSLYDKNVVLPPTSTKTSLRVLSSRDGIGPILEDCRVLTWCPASWTMSGRSRVSKPSAHGSGVHGGKSRV